MATTTLTPERLYEKAYLQIASAGEASNCGPDEKGTQMLALYEDIQVSTALNDILRVQELLTKAQAKYGT